MSEFVNADGQRPTCGQKRPDVMKLGMWAMMRLGSMLAIAMVLSGCAMEKKAGGERQLETLYMFAGEDGAMAYSIEESGANLPQQYAPWHFRGPVSTSGPTFKAGIDKAALEDVKAQGFAVSVWSITIGEDELP